MLSPKTQNLSQNLSESNPRLRLMTNEVFLSKVSKNQLQWFVRACMLNTWRASVNWVCFHLFPAPDVTVSVLVSADSGVALQFLSLAGCHCVVQSISKAVVDGFMPFPSSRLVIVQANSPTPYRHFQQMNEQNDFHLALAMEDKHLNIKLYISAAAESHSFTFWLCRLPTELLVRFQ